MKLIQIRQINPNDEQEIVNDALRCKIHYDASGVMFGLYVNGEIVSVATVEEMKRNVLLTFSYTKPEYRKKGYGLMLLKYRLAYCRMTTDKKITSSCMPTSLNLHLSQGAKIIRKCKDGGAMVYYEKN